jgi:hypothetical protein
MTENATEHETVTAEDENVPAEHENATSARREQVISAVRKSQQLTLETAKKLAEALSAAAASLPGRQLAHRLPAPPFAEGLPKLPKLPETDAVVAAARDFAGQLLAEQRRFAGEVVAEQRRFAGELVSAVSAPRAGSQEALGQDTAATE